MIRKVRVRWVAKRDSIGQATFVAELFGLAAQLPDSIAITYSLRNRSLNFAIEPPEVQWPYESQLGDLSQISRKGRDDVQLVPDVPRSANQEIRKQ